MHLGQSSLDASIETLISLPDVSFFELFDHSLIFLITWLGCFAELSFISVIDLKNVSLECSSLFGRTSLEIDAFLNLLIKLLILLLIGRIILIIILLNTLFIVLKIISIVILVLFLQFLYLLLLHFVLVRICLKNEIVELEEVVEWVTTYRF